MINKGAVLQQVKMHYTLSQIVYFDKMKTNLGSNEYKSYSVYSLFDSQKEAYAIGRTNSDENKSNKCNNSWLCYLRSTLN